MKVSDTWIPDHNAMNCQVCFVTFSFTTRKHHCRKCGCVCCSNCSRQKLEMFSNNSKMKQKQRVCDPCHTNHEKTSKSSINLYENINVKVPEKVQQITKGIDFKSGNLMKLGGKRQNWKLRYFVLNAYSLSYYQDVEEENLRKRSNQEMKLLKQIPLSNITKISVQKKREAGDYCFSLNTSMEEGRVFYIATDSITNFCEWLIAIDGLIIGSQKAARWNNSILD
eukprot:TRINITY_DN14318_c0_g1_i1.p1 TRINITY_DN14318_c0_g1~~TRINITY_DN14318_c0_g1_i1.p1  ORF type:complete len:224 (-),score=53.12 TRINITY_DN14318_c0_g1_i1:86-757(-)